MIHVPSSATDGLSFRRSKIHGLAQLLVYALGDQGGVDQILRALAAAGGPPQEVLLELSRERPLLPGR